MSLRLFSIQIQGFRAFKREVELNLNADSVLIYGNNGTGKTSIFDAIRWCLYGELTRFRGAEEFKEEETYRNIYAREKSFVEVTLGSSEEKLIVIRRELSNGSSVVSYVENGKHMFNKQAQDAIDSLVPAHIFDGTISLGQREISNFINFLRPSDRYQSLSQILGLNKISEFRALLLDELDSVNKRFKNVSEEISRYSEQLKDYENRQAQLRQSIASVLAEAGYSRESFRRISVDQLPSRIASIEKKILTLDEDVSRKKQRLAKVGELDDELSRLAEELSDLHDLQQELPMLVQESYELSEEYHRLKVEIERLQEKLQVVQAELKSSHLDEKEESTFLRLAIEHLKGPLCPICEQPFDIQLTVVKLRSKLESMNVKLRHLEKESRSLQINVTTSTDRLSTIDTRLKALDKEKDEIQNRINISQKRQLEILKNARTSVHIKAKDLSQLRSQLENATIRTNAEIDKLSSRKSELSKQIEALKFSLEILDSRKEIDNVVSKKNVMDEKKHSLNLVKSKLKYALDESLAAEASVIQETLNRYSEEINRNYSQLDPHPLFKELELKAETVGGKNKFYVRAKGLGKSINVRTGFSEAQSNCVALCIFLALSVAKRNIGFDTTMLDDPVQTMDDMNVLGLVDLLRTYMGYRQIIVATPHRDFFQILSQRLTQAGATQIRYSIRTYTEEGPEIQQLEPIEPPERINLPAILAQ